MKVPCSACDDCHWVCEAHPDRPWKEFSTRGDACDCAPGMPCPLCNKPGEGERPDLPPGVKVAMDDDKGPRH